MSDTSNVNVNKDKKHLNLWTVEELLALPHRHWDEVSVYNSILILPADYLHDSEYSCMIIIGIRDEQPVEIAASGCDDIEWKAPQMQIIGTMFSIGQFRMDCLATSKAFHPWSRDYNFQVDAALSSITIELIKAQDKKGN